MQQNPDVHEESQVVLFHNLNAYSLSVSVGGSHDGDKHVEQVKHDQEVSDEKEAFQVYGLLAIPEWECFIRGPTKHKLQTVAEGRRWVE